MLWELGSERFCGSRWRMGELWAGPAVPVPGVQKLAGGWEPFLFWEFGSSPRTSRTRQEPISRQIGGCFWDASVLGCCFHALIAKHFLRCLKPPEERKSLLLGGNQVLRHRGIRARGCFGPRNLNSHRKTFLHFSSS